MLLWSSPYSGQLWREGRRKLSLFLSSHKLASVETIMLSAGVVKTFLKILFIYFFFLWPHLGHVVVPGQKWNLSYSCDLMPQLGRTPQLQQCRILNPLCYKRTPGKTLFRFQSSEKFTKFLREIHSFFIITLFHLSLWIYFCLFLSQFIYFFPYSYF